MWLKIDDGFADHPKIEALSVEARWAHLRGLCYCARHKTDGAILASVAMRMATPPVLDELVKGGLWIETQAGYEIHDFLDFNFSRDEWERFTARKSKAGRKGAEARWSKPQDGDAQEDIASAMADAKADAIAPVMANGMANTMAKRWPSSSSSSSSSRPSPVHTHEGIRARDPEPDPPEPDPDPPDSDPPEADPEPEPPPPAASDVTLAAQLGELRRGMRSAYEELYRETWRFSWACEPGFRDRLREGRTVDELLNAWRWFLTSRKKRAQATPQSFLRYGWDEWCALEAARAPAVRGVPVAACEAVWPDGVEP